MPPGEPAATQPPSCPAVLRRAPERLRLGPPRLTVLQARQCWRVHPRNQELVTGAVMASRLVPPNASTVNDVLDGHKLLEIDCADRVYLTLSVPNLVVG